MLVVTQRIQIPLKEFVFDYMRSSGPGGQNVNKVATKAVLHWDVTTSRNLPDDVRARFLARFGRRVNQQGELVLTSQRFRDQGRNTADCLEKLRAMLAEVAVAPKRRKPTKPGKAARQRRLDGKREQSDKKQRRRFRPDD